MTKVFAAKQIDLGGSIEGEGLGRIGKNIIDSSQGIVDAISHIISPILGILTVAAGIWFLFMVLIGGYTYMSSMGDKKRLEEARDRIVYGLIGLVIIVSSWAIISLVGTFLGVDFLLNTNVLNTFF